MKYTYLIKNGHVVDPARGIDRVEDIYVLRSKIVEHVGSEPCTADEVVDATGCLVLPGLIDSHLHLNHRHTDYGIQPDVATFPYGITAGIDAGTAGSATFDGFYKNVVSPCTTTIKSFINITAIGVAAFPHNEIINPDIFDVERLQYFFEMYPGQLLGLKFRMGRELGNEYGLRPLIRTKEIAQMIGTHINVHVVDPDQTYSEILPHFGKGDILCHCFQARGSNTILEGGKICTAAKEARSRGVLFEAAGGRTLYDIRLIQAAMGEGFLPDLIGSDVANTCYLRPTLHSLLYVMALYRALGMPLSDMIRAMTETPARLMGLQGVIGTLAPGAMADISIMRLCEKKVTFRDFNGNVVAGKQIFVPEMTIKAGRPAYRQIGSIF